MKRTKRILLTTLVATLAISMALVSTAFAAPASTCPFKAAAPATEASQTQNLFGNLLNTGAAPADIAQSTCPSSALLQQLLQKLGIGTTAGTTADATANCTNGSCLTGNCTSGCTNGICLTGNCLTGGCSNGTCTTPDCQR